MIELVAHLPLCGQLESLNNMEAKVVAKCSVRARVTKISFTVLHSTHRTLAIQNVYQSVCQWQWCWWVGALMYMCFSVCLSHEGRQWWLPVLAVHWEGHNRATQPTGEQFKNHHKRIDYTTHIHSRQCGRWECGGYGERRNGYGYPMLTSTTIPTRTLSTSKTTLWCSGYLYIQVPDYKPWLEWQNHTCKQCTQT